MARGRGPPGRREPVESVGGPLMACAACAGTHLQAGRVDRGVGRGVVLRGRACVRRDAGQVACPGGCPARCGGTAGVPPRPHRGPAAVPARHFATGLDASAGSSERPGRVEAIARAPAGTGPPPQTTSLLLRAVITGCPPQSRADGSRPLVLYRRSWVPLPQPPLSAAHFEASEGALYVDPSDPSDQVPAAREASAWGVRGRGGVRNTAVTRAATVNNTR